jgi:CelD/BcsL family acetyltransferase involved in cellulose biosynthesis
MIGKTVDIKKNKLIIFEEFNEELKEKWLKIENTSTTIFQSYQWQKLWYDQIGQKYLGVIPKILVLQKNGQANYNIYPLCIRNINGIKCLEWMGYPFSDFNQSVFIDDDFNLSKLENIINDIQKHYLKKIDFINLNNNLLQNNLSDINLGKNLKFQSSNYRIIISNWKNYIKDKKFKFLIQDINRCKKNLLKIGSISYKEERQIKDVNQVIEFIIENKSNQLVRTYAWNYMKIKAYSKFIRKLIDNDNAHLSAVYLNDKIIAAHLGYIHRNVFYYVFPVFENNYKRYSPGNLLLIKLIKRMHFKKLEFFDFTIGDETYKKKWSNINQSFYSFKSYKSIKGLVFIIIEESKNLFSKNKLIKNFLRKIYHKIKK